MRANQDDLNDRLFRVDEVEVDAVARLLDGLSFLGIPSSSIRAPVWKNPDSEHRAIARNLIEEVKSSASEMEIVILSRDLERYFNYWDVPKEVCPENWFSYLKA